MLPSTWAWAGAEHRSAVYVTVVLRRTDPTEMVCGARPQGLETSALRHEKHGFCRGVLLFDFAQSSEPVELQDAPTGFLIREAEPSGLGRGLNCESRGSIYRTQIIFLCWSGDQQRAVEQ